MILLKNVSPVGVSNLLGVFSTTNWQPGGDNPNKFGTPALPGGDLSHNTVFFNKAFDTSLRPYSAGASLLLHLMVKRASEKAAGNASTMGTPSVQPRLAKNGREGTRTPDLTDVNRAL